MADRETASNPGLWGAIATTVGQLTNTIVTNTPKARENALAIAEANARAAEANASNSSIAQPLNTKVIAGIGVAVVVIVLIVVFAKRSNND